jgi:PAS domain-containing protein
MPAAADRCRLRERSVRYHLAVLAVALALPVTVFVGVLLWRIADAERVRLEGQASATAHAVAVAVDRELAGLVSTVEVMSLFGSLQAGDLQTFRTQAEATRDLTGIDVVVRDLSGQQLVNTRLPRGEPLPRGTEVDSDSEALRTGRPVVSGLFRGAVAQAPLFTIVAPVRSAAPGGGVAFLLSLSLPVERMRRALEEELASSATPADWTVALVDRAGLILARSRAHEEFVGTPANRSLQDATREGQAGTWRGTTLEGRAIHGAFARSSLADWRVAVGVPEAVLTAPLRQSLLLLLTLGAGLAGLSAALALWLGGRVALPIGALAKRAAALGRGEAVAPLLTPVREVNRVAAELEAASASLGEREAALRASEARLRAILETVPVGVVIAEAPSGRIVEGNKQAERVFGHPVLPSAGVEDYREWVSHHPDGREVAPSEYPLSRCGAARSAPSWRCSISAATRARRGCASSRRPSGTRRGGPGAASWPAST